MAYQTPQLVLVGAAAKIVLGQLAVQKKYLDLPPVAGEIQFSRNTVRP